MRALAFVLLLAIVAPAADHVPDWKSIADPPKELPKWKVDAKLGVVTPPHFFDGGVEFAAGGGPFALAGRNGGKGEHRLLIDLRTGKTIGKLTAEFEGLGPGGPTALSHDGKWYAGSTGGRFGQQGSVLIFDVMNDKKAIELPMNGELDVLQFAGDRLLVSTKTESDVYDVKTWKSIFNQDHQRNTWGGAKSTLSPTGKYLVETVGQGLRLYDVDAGKSMFKLESPKGPKGATNADGVAFSPDGKRLAIATEAYGQRTLVIYDTATGKPLFDNVIAIKNVFHPTRVAWSVDSQGILLNGEAIADPETGKVVFEFPANTHGNRLALTLGQGVVWDTSNRNGRKLVVVGLDAEKTAAAKAAVVSGGTAADVNMHALTKSTLDKSKAVAAPLIGVEWKARPDPAPPTPAAQRPIPIDFGMQNIRAFFITPGEKSVALFEFTPNGNDATRSRQAKRVELLTGKTTATFDVPPTLQSEDISPNGKMLLTYDFPTGRRVDVFSLDGGQPVGIRPYSNEPEGGQKLSMMRFLSDDRLLTVSEQNLIAVWSLPDLKPVFVTELPGAKALTLSPNRQYLAAIHAGAVRVIDLLNSKYVGDLIPPFNTLETPQSSFIIFRADGREVLAGFQHANNTPMLVRWDTLTGKVNAEDVFTGNLGSRPKQGYVGDNYVMFDFGWIYDLKRRAFVWNLNQGFGAYAWYRPDDRVWYAINGFNNDGYLVAANFATAEVDKTIADVIDGPGAILKPGTSVSLSLQAEGGLANEYQPKIADALRKSWKSRELQVVNQNADVEVTMTVSERDTGDKLSFRNFGSPFGDTVPVLELTAETVVSVNGEELWSPAPAKYRTQGGFIRLPQGETLSTYLHKQTWNEVLTWSQNSALPKYLAKTENGIRVLPMFSKLTPAGITDEVKRRR